MTFAQSIRTCFNKYATFSGRAPRSEFWWFALFYQMGNVVIAELQGGINAAAHGDVSLLSTVFGLSMFLPYLAVTVRRLHDTDRSGWSWLIALIPLIGIIVLILWLADEGDAAPNGYGPDPLGASDDRGAEGDDNDPDDGSGPSGTPPLRKSDIPTVRR